MANSPPCDFCEAPTPAIWWSIGTPSPVVLAEDGEGLFFACDAHREALREAADPAVAIFPVSKTVVEIMDEMMRNLEKLEVNNALG